MRTAAGPVPLATVTGDVHSRAAVQHTVVGEYVYDMESGASGGGGGGGSSDGGERVAQRCPVEAEAVPKGGAPVF